MGNVALRRVGSIIAITCLVSLTFLVFPATPALACSCVGGRTAGDYLDEADAAFVGDVISSRPVEVSPAGGRDGLQVGSPPLVFTFDVHHVYKGAVAERQEVVSSLDEASCGVAFETGRRYVVYARTGPESGPSASSLSTSLCAGTQPVAAMGPIVEPPLRINPPAERVPPSPGPSLAALGGIALLSAAAGAAMLRLAGRT